MHGDGWDTERTTDDTHWKEQFAREYERLIGALGEITDGGIVEQVEHVGATSVPGLLGQPCIDMALAVWPFPLEEPARPTSCATRSGFYKNHPITKLEKDAEKLIRLLDKSVRQGYYIHM